MNNDITIFINWFINIFITIWDWFWNFLRSFQFNNTSLYWFVIIIIVLRIGIPIVVQLHDEGKTNELKIERSKYKERKK